MSGIYRGFYGPVPSELLSDATLRILGIRAFLSAQFGSRTPQNRRFRDVDRNEAVLLSRCLDSLRVPMWCPDRVPSGFAVTSAKPTTTMGDSAVLRLIATPTGEEFEVAHRPSWLPLAEELATARVPFSRVRLGPRGPEAFVMYGRFGGEPIDGSYWMTRQAVLFEVGGGVTELREIRATGPGLSRLLSYARELSGRSV